MTPRRRRPGPGASCSAEAPPGPAHFRGFDGREAAETSARRHLDDARARADALGSGSIRRAGAPAVSAPADPPTSRFRAHGDIDALKQGSIIRAAGVGPFNVEAVAGYARHMAQLVAGVEPGGRFVVIARMSRSILAPPDAWATLEASIHSRQLGSTRQVGAAWVKEGEVEGWALMIPRVTAIYAAVGVPFRAFDDDDAATAWAETLLAAH